MSAAHPTPGSRRGGVGRTALRIVGALLLVAVTVSIAWVASYRWRDPPMPDWVPLAEISVPLQIAVVLAEDQHFCVHHGLDFDSIDAALAAARAGKPLVGASTLSQQLAKNLFLWPERSWLRKGLEVWFTVWLEVLLPKARILELYLNIAEWGPQVHGVGAAVRFHFARGASPGSLGPRQSAHLAVLLPAPVRLSAQLPAAASARRDHIERAVEVFGTAPIACLR